MSPTRVAWYIGNILSIASFLTGTLFELIKAANYLDIPELVEITCKTVANMIKGKSPEQIRDTFNIQDRFTADEEEHIRKENKMLN